MPVVEALARELAVPISVDTSKPEVMRAAVAAGAGMINDVRALRRPGALAAAAARRVPVCLMHMQGEPGTMQQEPPYADVVGEVAAFLAGRARGLRGRGHSPRAALVDPGFGFGKTLEHNLAPAARPGRASAMLRRAGAGGAVAQVDDRRAARRRAGGGAAGTAASRRR